MAFSETTKKQIFDNADGKCQMRGCGKQLVFDNQQEGERGAWHAHHIKYVSNGGSDDVSNGVALCIQHHKDVHADD